MTQASAPITLKKLTFWIPKTVTPLFNRSESLGPGDEVLTLPRLLESEVYSDDREDHIDEITVPTLFRTRRRHQAIAPLGEALWYTFSDGTILSLFDLYRSPYRERVLSDLVPMRMAKLPDTAAHDLQNLWEASLVSEEENHWILSALLKASRLSDAGRLDVMIAFESPDNPHQATAYKIERLGYLRKDRDTFPELPRPKWTLTTEAGVSSDGTPNALPTSLLGYEWDGTSPNELVIYPGFYFNPADRSLIFHPFGHQLVQFAPVLGHPQRGTYRFQSSPSTLERIRDAFRAQGLEWNDLLKASSVKTLDVSEGQHCQIELYSGHLFQVRWTHPELPGGAAPVSWVRFPKWFHRALQVLQFGIRPWLNLDEEDRLLSRTQSRRERELRMLRSGGFAATLINQKLRQKKDPSFWLLVSDWSLPQENHLNSDTRDSFSRAYQEIFEARMDEWDRERNSGDPVWSLQDGTLWVLKGYNDWCSKLLMKLIERWEAADRKPLILRDRIPLLQWLVSENEVLPNEIPEPMSRDTADSLYYALPEPLRTSDVLLEWKSLGAQVIENGRQIEAFQPERFQVKFKLEEHSGVEPVEMAPGSMTGAVGGTYREDWFELAPEFWIDGEKRSLEEVQTLVREGKLDLGGKVIYLPELESLGSVGVWLERLQSIGGNEPKTARGFYPIPKNQTLELLALRKLGIPIEGGPRWEAICRFFDSLSDTRTPMQPPKGFNAELKPYQVRGMQWVYDLYNLGLGGVLADDMGLGKTVQTLAFLETLRQEGRLEKSLIVVPTSLTYNWKRESERFSPGLPFHVFSSRAHDQVHKFFQENPHGVLLTTYGLFAEHEEFFQSFRWNMHIYDEAQNLKNMNSKRTTTSRKIHARFKLCLTGTPLENHYGEFFSLLDLAVPGCLGDMRGFRRKYLNPEGVRPRDLDFLKLKVRPLVLRRTKKELLKELPPKMESTLSLPFQQKQKAYYRDIAVTWMSKVKESIKAQGLAQSQVLMLTALLRLRQICSDPASVPGIDYPEIPPKVALLGDSLEEIIAAGESALVYTQFLKTFARIEGLLISKNIPVYTLHGSMSRKDREEQLQGFEHHEGGAVLLMTLKTGGVGLNLTKASYIFHLEPWWNPAVENQATDRAHRIGQTKSVQVYRYLMEQSVEEKIEALKKRKDAKFDALFGDLEEVGEKAATGSFSLSQEDFEYLIHSNEGEKNTSEAESEADDEEELLSGPEEFTIS